MSSVRGANTIIPGLWLGSLPDKVSIIPLKEHGINAISTIRTEPLLKVDFNSFRRKLIFAEDDESQNPLISFPKAFNFIEENLANAVLLHW